MAYGARFRAYGTRQYVTLGNSRDGFTRRDAEAELQNILADDRRGIWRPPSSPLVAVPAADPGFHEFASAWVAARQAEVAPRTVDDYRWALSNHFLPFFAKHRLSEITIAEVDRYRASKCGAVCADGARGTRTPDLLGAIQEMACRSTRFGRR
jgi:Phage integrase, N-terminal SAM-like domain